jgi:hypothetical protein
MAAGSIATGVVLGLVAFSRAADPPDVYKVTLELRIAGVGRNGCDVEIKPGHAGCSFRTRSQHLEGQSGWGKLDLKFDDVQSTSADRDCSFTITIHETGQADRTVHRGLRLAPSKPGQPAQVQKLTCLLNSPSMLARSDRTRRPQ